MSVPTITIELFGIPRARAGLAELKVSAATVSDALGLLAEACPGLEDVLLPDGRLAPHYLVSLDGKRFLTNLKQTLQVGDRLLLLSADPGG